MKKFYEICSKIADLVGDQLDNDEIEDCARMGLAQSDKIPTRIAIQIAIKRMERRQARRFYDPLCLPFREANGYNRDGDWLLSRLFAAPRIGRR